MNQVITLVLVPEEAAVLVEALVLYETDYASTHSRANFDISEEILSMIDTAKELAKGEEATHV